MLNSVHTVGVYFIRLLYTRLMLGLASLPLMCLLHSDWLKAMQFSGNSAEIGNPLQKEVINLAF